MTKLTYKEAKNKQAVRNLLFSYFNKESIIGLAGPDINEYLSWCKKNGYKKVEIWENNQEIMLSQLSKIKTKLPIHYKFGDIINADLKSDCVYDLDYCGSVVSLHEHAIKFKSQRFVMTFSTRPVGISETINRFFSARKEKIKSIDNVNIPIPHSVVKTTFSTYIVAAYFDTSSMVSIAKIS